MTKSYRHWINLTLVGLVILFTLQNIAFVEVSFLFWSFELPRALLVFLIFVIGVVSGWLFCRAQRKS
jgi:uncharacterized integral membrane protein